MSKIDNQFFICKKLLTTITPAFLIITVIYIVLIGIYTYSYSEELGIMGDFIGGTLNPIFAFTSFMALLYTIKLQSETIELQIKDLKLTREELSQSRKAQQDSADTLKQQRFEMTFFSLLSLLESRIKRFELYIDGKKYECNKEDYEKHNFHSKKQKV